MFSELLDDRARDLVLEREDVLELPVIVVGEQVVPVRGADQLRSYPDLIAEASYRSL